MSEMLAELNDMNECLLEIETRGVISAATAAAVAGGGPSRTASTDAGEAGVTDDRGAPHPPPPVPDTLEAVSGALEGRGSAVPQQVAAVAGVNIIIPAVIPRWRWAPSFRGKQPTVVLLLRRRREEEADVQLLLHRRRQPPTARGRRHPDPSREVPCPY
ncbi:unnamed protein product [Ectocarpus sp. 8 AP-2014]